MAANPVKMVKVIPLDPKTLGLKPKCDPSETPAKAPVPQNNIPEPAITFEYNRVGCADGTMTENGHIYDTFLKINEECLNTSVDALQSKEVNYSFLSSSINIEATSAYKIIQNSYRSAVTNHWFNFVTMFNYYIDTFTKGNYPKNPSCHMELDHADIYHLGYYMPYEYNFDGVVDFINLPYKERDNVISSGALHAHIAAAVNNVGISMYKTAYERLCKALAISKMESDDQESLLKHAVETFNCMFADLMANITYEESVYYQNLVNFHSMIPSKTDITKIKNLGGKPDHEPEYFTPTSDDYSDFRLF